MVDNVQIAVVDNVQIAVVDDVQIAVADDVDVAAIDHGGEGGSPGRRLLGSCSQGSRASHG